MRGSMSSGWDSWICILNAVCSYMYGVHDVCGAFVCGICMCVFRSYTMQSIYGKCDVVNVVCCGRHMYI